MNCFKKCRERKGFTQKEVAISLGVSIQAVSYWENGERMPSYAKLLQLAKLYAVTTDELLGRGEPEHRTVETAEEQPTAQGDGLREGLANLIADLSPEETRRVSDFVSGLKSARKP